MWALLPRGERGLYSCVLWRYVTWTFDGLLAVLKLIQKIWSLAPIHSETLRQFYCLLQPLFVMKFCHWIYSIFLSNTFNPKSCYLIKILKHEKNVLYIHVLWILINTSIVALIKLCYSQFEEVKKKWRRHRYDLFYFCSGNGTVIKKS